MKNKKKIILILLFVLLAAAAAGVGSAETGSGGSFKTYDSADETKAAELLLIKLF